MLPEVLRRPKAAAIELFKALYINAFRQLPTMSWRDEPVVIFDGGTGFFGVEYDPVLKSFSEFQFNGYA